MSVENIAGDCRSPCRFCGELKAQLTDIHSEKCSEVDLVGKINQYLPSEVSQIEDITTKCCNGCVSTILSWHKFVLKAKETTVLLRLKTEESQSNINNGQGKLCKESDEDTSSHSITTIKKESTDWGDDSETFDNNDFHQSTSWDQDHDDLKDVSDEKEEISTINPGSDFETKTETKAKFSCEICFSTFTTRHNLRRHMNIQHIGINFHDRTEKSKKLDNKLVKIRRKNNEVDKKSFCEICEKGFSRKFDMQRHIKLKHPEVKIYDSYTRANNNEILKKCRIIENGRTVFVCDICQHRSNQSCNLIRHRTIHTDVKAYVCHICGRGFRLESVLRNHLRLFHERVKNFKCDVCGKEFGVKSARDEHMNIHSDNRPFSCNICQKAFRHKSSLYTHKIFHSQNFRYECKICDKKFRRTHELEIHKRLHTGHKPYKCKCGKAFRLSQSLKRHEKLHLKNNVEWVCTECQAFFSQERYLKLHKKIHIRNEDTCKNEPQDISA